MNFKSRMLALVLVLTFLVGALPMTASAATDITAQITDANLLQAVRDRLGKTASDPVTDVEMASIIDLNAFERGITSLEGLQYATSLQELFVNNNAISDLSPLSGLTSLKRLNLWDNDITDITPLSGLTGLNNLDLNTNSISDLSPLSGMTSLEALSLYENSITDISVISSLIALRDLQLDSNPGITDYSPLAGLSSLHGLSLAHNGITSVSTLSSLTGLTWLTLEGNQISDISPLADMTGMQRLDLGANAIQDISVLANMPDLFELILFTNQISDISPLSGLTDMILLELHDNLIRNVSPLSGLTSLRYLYLHRNKISDIRPLDTLIANDSALAELYMGYNYLNLTEGTDYQGQAYAAAATIAVLNTRGVAIGSTTTTQYDLASTPFAAQAAHTSSSVTISWDPIPNTNYGIARSGEDGVAVTFFGRFDGNRTTTYTDNTVVPNCSYVYTVLADIYRGDPFVVEPVHLSQTVAVTTDTDPSMTGPVFTVQPKNAAHTYGDTARFSVYAVSPNAGVLSYQWQVSADGGLNWDDVAAGANAAAYRTNALSAADNGAMYRCAVTNTKGGTVNTLYSNPATVTLSAYSPESDFYFFADANAIYDYLGSSEIVNIPPTFGGTPATTIALGAFSYCNTITRVVVPSGITTIDMQAFYNCSNLKSVSLPSSLTTLGAAAFMYDTALTSITIPPNITLIGDSTFMYASNLARILFLGAPPALGSQVFFGVPGPLKINYYADNTAFAAAVSGGKWNGYDAIPLVTVTYNANGATGGDVPTDAAIYEPGQSATVAGNTGSLTNDDLVFVGWNTADDGSGVHYDADAALPIDGTGNVTLYAEWAALPVITTAALADGVAGVSYSQALAADGTAPITWSLVSGALPGGLSLNTSTGVISGYPTAAGTYPFTVQATNNVGNDTQALNITVSVPPFITTTSLPGGAVGVPYSQTLVSDGTTPITWSLDAGTLPDGLTLATDTGVISGIPTLPNMYTFTVKAANAAGNNTRVLFIAIGILPSINNSSLPDGKVGTAYNQILTADGTVPITWTVSAGSLPGGLSLDAGTGVISGTPATAGTYDFTVKATNSAGNDTHALSITITDPPTITTSILPNGTVGVPYSQALAATGTTPITWSLDAGALPDGLSLAADTGVISGTPPTADTYNFIVRATNSVDIDTQALSITINPAPTVTGVTVSPAAVSVLKGRTQAFTAVVEGLNYPSQTVIWAVTGGVTGTTISTSGLLTVAAGETAATLTVTATSFANTSKSSSASVTVLAPTPAPTPTPQTPSSYLEDITLSVGKLSPTFKPKTTDYTLTLGENDDQVKITPVKAYSKATIIIDDKKVDSKTVKLANGKSVQMIIKVTWNNRSTTYKLTIKRPKSTNNRLSKITATAGKLSPTFSPGVNSYKLMLPANVSRVTIQVTRSSPLAKVYTAARKTFYPRKGQTIKVTFRVQAQSGGSRTYTVIITRAKK